MGITVATPDADRLESILEALAGQEGLPVQLHPGDLGWHGRFGEEEVARSLRVWRRDDEIVAVGFLDVPARAGEPAVIRMGLIPAVGGADELSWEVADALVADLGGGTGVVPATEGLAVEARFGEAFRDLLTERGWLPDEAWTPLRRDLSDPVEEPALRVVTTGPDQVEDRVAVQRAAFPRSTFTVERWLTMSRTPAYRHARCLVGYDGEVAVAAATVWSAGAGRPGLLEPMGVHRDHRGSGHGRAITLAAAAALREMGASSATVATPAANRPGVATYLAAGFRADPDVTDFRRPPAGG